MLSKYSSYYWAVAWSDFNFDVSNLLVKHSDRIKQISVGLSFHGTKIEFLKKFKNHTGVNFVLQNKGTFHPKVYLFENGADDWELLVGSANFTNSAFSNNTEASILLSSKDKGSAKVYGDAKMFLKDQWSKGETIGDEFIRSYAKNRNRERPPSKVSRIDLHKPLYLKSWKQYLKELKATEYKQYLKFLNWVRLRFKEQPVFHKMDLDTRKSIAGFGHENDVSIGCFGTTKARGFFMKSIIEKPEIITKAFACIPKKGLVSREDYYSFIKIFRKVSKHNEVACASRMLCLWRPDYFVNYNGENKEGLSKELRFPKTKMSYETYWDFLVEPFLAANWTLETGPRSKSNKEIYENRVALMDSIYVDFY